jgi:hypothetical protein
MGIAFWRATLQTRYPNLEAANEFVESLLHPSAKDLAKSVARVEPLRPEWPQGEGETDLDVGEFGEVVQRLRGGEFSRLYYANDWEAEINVPERLRQIAWRFWSESDAPVNRARTALVLAAYNNEEANESVLLQAFLRYASYESSLPKNEWLPVLSRLASLSYTREGPLVAYALWNREEMELGFRGASENFGSAVYNQGIALQTAGFPAAAELVFLRLMASHVNDRDAGSDLMTAARNYRHNAARSIAKSSGERGLYLNALAWNYRALNEFEFRSWCGTCNQSAAGSARLALLNTAFMAGPLFVAMVLISRPFDYGLHWIGSMAAVISFWRQARRMRRRSREADRAEHP